MKIKKLLALLLAALICFSSLVACTDTSDEVNEKEEDEEEENVDDGDEDDEDEDNKDDEDDRGDTSSHPSEPEKYPELNKFASADYKGEDFTFLFLQYSLGSKDYYGGNYLDPDTFEGMTVEGAVHERNLAIEEKYNVNINQRIVDVNRSDPITVLQTFAMSGDYSFDAIYGWGYKMGACIVENLLADIKTLPNVDLTQEYWSPSTMEDLTVNGKLYITISDISMNKLEWGSMLYFNKQIVEDYGLEAKIGNFYDLVNEGQWTLDKFLEAVTSVSTDVDSSGTIDNNDLYGLIDGDASGFGLGLACGVELTQKQESGDYKVSYYNTDSVGLAQKINAVYSDPRFVKNYEHLGVDASIPDGMDQWEYYRSFFSREHSLFCTGTANIVSEFRGMEDPFGILPMPKKDENQKDYISTIDSNASLFAIPSTYRQDVTTAGPERTGLILETLSFMSLYVVLPKYYETFLNNQRLDDENDRMMLEIVRNNARYIFSEMMGGDALREIGSNCQQMFMSPASATSLYRGKESIMNKALADFYADVLKLD